MMITQNALQVRKVVGRQMAPWLAALKRVAFCLALCLLIVSIAAPAVAASSGNDDSAPPQRLYASLGGVIWVSDDAGISWTQAGALPSRSLAIAAGSGTLGLVFVGTESSGLVRSTDGGASWQPVDSATLTGGYAGPLAVTALAIDPENEQIVYAATNIWLGTHTAHLSPFGVAVSVDGGAQWIQLSRANLDDTPLLSLEPVAGRPLTVVALNSSTARPHTLSLVLSPELLDLLQDGDPAVRASAARAIGLIGDSAALPALVQALGDPDALTGQRAVDAIGRIGDPSANADLLQILVSAPVAERMRAASALGLLKSEEAVPGLATLFKSYAPGARSVATRALAAIGTPEAIAVFMAPLADQELTSARHAAMEGLELAGPTAVAPLAAALADTNPVVRANAAEMLGWLKATGAAPDLTALLSDSDSIVRVQATWALGEMGRLAPVPAPMPAPKQASPILTPMGIRPVTSAPLPALPETFADVWPVSAIVALLALNLLAVVLIWRGQRPASRLGHV
jgi:HEAT repeat protein